MFLELLLQIPKPWPCLIVFISQKQCTLLETFRVFFLLLVFCSFRMVRPGFGFHFIHIPGNLMSSFNWQTFTLSSESLPHTMSFITLLPPDSVFSLYNISIKCYASWIDLQLFSYVYVCVLLHPPTTHTLSFSATHTRSLTLCLHPREDFLSFVFPLLQLVCPPVLY